MQHERLENFELRCKVLSNAPDMEDCREFHELVSEIGVRGLEEFQTEKQQVADAGREARQGRSAESENNCKTKAQGTLHETIVT